MFVPVTAEAFAKTFGAAGFVATSVGSEVVYERAHTNPEFVIRVFTTLPVNGQTVRGSGEDAIRACLVHRRNGKTTGMDKNIIVKRTAPAKLTAAEQEAHVMERALERVREMWNQVTYYCKEAARNARTFNVKP